MHPADIKFPRVDWSDSTQCQLFATYVEATATTLPQVDIDSVLDHESARIKIDIMCDTMKTAVHKAAQLVHNHRQSSYRGRHKKKHWWNSDCLYNRDRQRFWFRLWKAAGKPRTGHVYSCYKLAKKSFRKVCRQAVNNGMTQTFQQLDLLRGHRNMNKFWNLVRRSKCTSGSTTSDIKLDTLHDYFDEKFAYDSNDASDTVRYASKQVNERYEEVKSQVKSDFVITPAMLTTYIDRLRNGCAAGIDGISAEHIKWSKNSFILPVLCDMLTLCVRFGIVADSFTKGLLIPLLKKPNADPTVPKNYRPIVISTTFSKLLEIHLLSMCGEHEFHDLQFGFVGSRGTSMAVAMTHDIIDYCVSNGSPVYVCALDAEGAFDGIPHAVMFSKALDVIPMLYWRLLIYWYNHLVVYVRWGGHMSEPIIIKKGTRQGGLSSPFVFNLLYQDLVAQLSNMPCGICIDGTTYNLCCYADDLLLCSLTTSGLQHLIDAADDYITQHGLRFNPSKTTCVTFGKSPFTNRQWYLQGTPLTETSSVKHLGVMLSNDTRCHAESRIQAARRAFYSLQGAGLCVNGCNPGTIAHIYNTALRPVLTYGLESVHMGKTVMNNVETIQGKFLKAALGLKPRCKSTPLLKALGIDRIQTHIEVQRLSLFKSVFLSTSRTNVFYMYLLTNALQGRLSSQRNLVTSVLQICDKYNLSLANYLCDKSYKSLCKRAIKSRAPCGLADSVKYSLIVNCDILTVNELLKSY
jgi:hypothetical protein